MEKIKLSPELVDYLKEKKLADKTLLLITDDAGGKYSIGGGACSIGGKFSLIEADELEPQYDIQLENEAGIKLFTSKYDLNFLGTGLAMDIRNGAIRLKNDSQLLDSFVGLSSTKKIMAAFDNKDIPDAGKC